MQYWEYDIGQDHLYIGLQKEMNNVQENANAGYSREQALKLIKEEDREVFLSSVEQLRSGKSFFCVVEFRSSVRNGTEKWYRSTGIVLRSSAEGSPLTLGGIIQDITGHKQIQLRLNEALKKAEETDKLKSAFLSNISHELRTPLNAIIGFSELIIDPNVSKEDIYTYAGIIKSRSTHLLQVVGDILDISRLESNLLEIKETAFALNPFLDDLFLIYAQKLLDEKKGNIHLHIDKALHDASFLIISDEYRLKQILGNLIDNAIKFTRHGSITFGYKLNEKELLFFVRDTGIGIPPDKHGIIFDRFSQADNSMVRQFGGNGLGLAICKALVEIMGGRIWLESKTEVGSEFIFTLPPSKVAISDMPKVAKSAGVQIQNWLNKRILLVEDDPLSAGLLGDVFGRTGAEVVTAGNGREALRFFTNEHFDIVIMDILLPDVSGLEITRIIKQQKPDIPVIAQTAYAMPGDNLQCLQAGCDEYITKPVNICELISLMNRYFRQ
jgi:signal transduction histidine kinase